MRRESQLARLGERGRGETPSKLVDSLGETTNLSGCSNLPRGHWHTALKLAVYNADRVPTFLKLRIGKNIYINQIHTGWVTRIGRVGCGCRKGSLRSLLVVECVEVSILYEKTSE